MEFSTVKRNRGRRKRRNLKKRHSEQVKFEVKSTKRRRFTSEHTDIFISKNKFISNTMHANSFWENYTIAQEWQNRHSVTWWRTRCLALEFENKILREKLRSVASQNTQNLYYTQRNQGYEDQQVGEEDEMGSTEDNENLEFHVNEDMLNFLEQSIKHKIELKKKREAELSAEKEEEKNRNECIQGGAAWVHARNTNAKLLYGEASATILAMETALQTTVDRHKDKARPQLWPIIPLKS